MAPEGCSTLEVVTLAPYEPFARWDGMKSFKRGEAYMAKKDEVAASVRRSVEQRWPGLIGDIVVEDVATPVTNTHYVNAPRGSIYGPAATPDQFGLNSFRPWTPVRGLVLAGAGTLGPGVGTCLASGLAAAKVVRRGERRRSHYFRLPRPMRMLRPRTA